MSEEYSTYSLGDFKLQSGATIPAAHIAYKTVGDPSLPAIIYPTWYSGLISDNLWLIGSSHALSPEKYYIIIPALFGNSQSSSPSNTTFGNNAAFPHVTFYDNVRAQHELVTKHLHIQHAFAVLGWSMGAGQTYQWATQYPTFMDKIAPFCGSARTSLHNKVFLEGVKSALLAAKGIPSAGVCNDTSPGTRTWSAAEKSHGLKALGRVYAGWGFSQAFYRRQLYMTAPAFKGQFRDLEDFMEKFWEGWACSKEPENMLTMLWTWQSGDCSDQPAYRPEGLSPVERERSEDDAVFKKAMQAIRAKALVMPCQTDLYFPPEDSEYECECMREGVGKCEPFPSIWGHWAGGPGQSVEDVKWLDEKLKSFFAQHELPTRPK